eukprot:scaffold54828_cov30-Tisochrysis_lutea.AAC.11
MYVVGIEIEVDTVEDEAALDDQDVEPRRGDVQQHARASGDHDGIAFDREWTTAPRGVPRPKVDVSVPRFRRSCCQTETFNENGHDASTWIRRVRPAVEPGRARDAMHQDRCHLTFDSCNSNVERVDHVAKSAAID